MDYLEYKNYLAHHGVKGQSWGKRRYQNMDGTLTPEGRQRYGIGDALRTRAISLKDAVRNKGLTKLANTKNYSAVKYNDNYVGIQSNKDLRKESRNDDYSVLFGAGKVPEYNRYYAERYTGEDDKEYYDKQIGKVRVQKYSQEGYKVFQVTLGNMSNHKVSSSQGNIAVGKNIIDTMSRPVKSVSNGNSTATLETIKGRVNSANVIVPQKNSEAQKPTQDKVNAPTGNYSKTNTKEVSKQVKGNGGTWTVQYMSSSKSSGNTTADMEAEKGKKNAEYLTKNKKKNK